MMNAINTYLLETSAERCAYLYEAFGVVMYIVFTVLFCWAVKNKSLRKRDALFLIIAFVVSYFSAIEIWSLLNRATDGVVPVSNVGVAFLPFVVVLSGIAFICKLPILISLDMTVPIYIAGRGACVIGCVFSGCCHGFPAEWGLYSRRVDLNTVPCPIIDSVVSLLIVVCLMYAEKKRIIRKKGIVAALGVTFFGVLRFVIDVLRDNTKLFGMITFEGICGIVMVLTGLVMLYIIDKKKSSTTTTKQLFFS